jgi:tRNA (cytidine/uridine-2'-O-)-methyltransferase
VALYEPRIPQNTGNIGRLVLGMGGRLHLVGRLGFKTDERACRRAGLDYWQHLDWTRHPDLAALRAALPPPGRLFAFSARAEHFYTDVEFQAGDCLLFGDEERGLPQELLDEATGSSQVQAVRIPVSSAHVRSFNLANAAAMACAEVSRQLGWPRAGEPRPRLEASCKSS